MGTAAGAAKSRAKLALAYTESERREHVRSAALKRWEGKSAAERIAEMESCWEGLERFLVKRRADVEQAREHAKEKK